MRKTALILIFTAVLLISCKKQYTCHCTVSVYDYNETVPRVFKSETTPIEKKLTRKQAEDICDHQEAALNATYRNMFYSLTFTTTLGANAASDCVLK